jgi:hypothetical protein
VYNNSFLLIMMLMVIQIWSCGVLVEGTDSLSDAMLKSSSIIMTDTDQN